MLRGVPLLVALMGASVGAATSVEIITADDWARPRSGDSLVQMPALKRTVRHYLDGRPSDSEAHRRIVIRHPRGEEGVIWAEELRGWLVSLGIPSSDIAVSPESTRIDALELAVVDAEN